MKLIAALSLCLLLAQPLRAEPVTLPAPSADDTCPVCGMFVAKYPEWIATVQYEDGHSHHFDGAKDMFKYLFNLARWAPGDRAENITTIGVTEYYGLTRIDARTAHYVVGSDVLGPMGHELVPLANEADAQEFKHDHRGTRILSFGQVDKQLPERLDNGVFD